MSLTGYLEAKQKLVGKLTRIPELDKTLTKEGYSADAAAVGAALEERAPISHVSDTSNPHKVTAAQVGARPATWTPTASDVGADAAGTAESVTAQHNVAIDTHNDIRLLIEGLASRLNALANCDDTTLDQMAEVVDYIKANRELIESITTSKVSVTDIVDNLTTNVGDKPLSAAQGVALKTLVDNLTTAHGNHEANKSNPHGVTAAQVGARPDTWMPTAAQVGAAPDGYGLGSEKCNTDNTHANDCLASGWYRVAFDTPLEDAFWLIRVDCYSASYVKQTAYAIAGASGIDSMCVCRRYMENGAWSAWEWENPPMYTGVEYRTTKRYLNAPVYIKMIDAGYISSGSSQISHGISGIIDAIGIRMINQHAEVTHYSGNTSITFDASAVNISSTGDYGSVQFILEYTK